MKTSCEEQIRRKPDQWAQYHTQKAPVSSTLPVATQSPTPPSPLFSVDFRTDVRKVLTTLVITDVQTDDFKLWLTDLFIFGMVLYEVKPPGGGGTRL